MFTLRERSRYSRLWTVHEEELSGILTDAQDLIQVTFFRYRFKVHGKLAAGKIQRFSESHGENSGLKPSLIVF